MLDTASRLMQAGATPSVSDVAEAAGVSRATAYRYFPSQAALVQAVVDEGLGPILTWRSRSRDPRRRVDELLDTAMPRIEAFEATFKAALKLSLDQWAQRQAGTLGIGAAVHARPSRRPLEGRHCTAASFTCRRQASSAWPRPCRWCSASKC